MKLVPLGDKIVLKQLEAEEDNKIRNCSSWSGKRETAGGRGNCSRSGRNDRWKRSDHAGKGWR